MFSAEAIIVIASALLHSSEPLESTAAQAVERYQQHLRNGTGLVCGMPSESSEIVVCGKRQRSPYRVPIDVEPQAGARVRGDPIHPREVMVMNPSSCPPPQRPRQSPGIDVLAVAATVAVVALNVLDKDRPKPQKPAC